MFKLRSLFENSLSLAPPYEALNTTKLPLTIDTRALQSFVGRYRELMPPPSDLLQGTLDLLILKTLDLRRMHGWAISQRIQQRSNDALQIGQGSLYPALHRLEWKGWIEAEWGTSENNRKAKFYSLTRAGRKQLESEVEQWSRLSKAVGLVLSAN